MVRAESVTATLVYTYSAAGLRVAQSVDGDETTFAWDWASGLPEMLSEGGNLSLVGHETLGQWDGNEWAYHLPDVLDSVRQVADGAGSVLDSREWTPYGVEVGAAQAGLGYTGEWWDAGVGLQYLRARWYDVGVGRFTSRDPWEGDHLQPQSLHPYAYVENNAINLTDPSGQIPDGLVVGRVTNFTGGIPFIKWLNAVYKLAGGCQLPHGEIFNVVGFGTETVYDFVHRQKQQFDIAYYGLDPLQLVGIELSFYEGLATGFQEVEEIANYAGLGLVTAPPAGLSFSAAILEAGGGISFVEAIERPGVDVIAVGLSLEFGVGWPGPALEEGATGIYWGLTAVAPVKNTFQEIQDWATLESEIRRSTSLITEIAIQSARFWWYWGAQQ
jgi:RHS repeat-associated protein